MYSNKQINLSTALEVLK